MPHTDTIPGDSNWYNTKHNCILTGTVENRKTLEIDRVKDVGGNEKCKRIPFLRIPWKPECRERLSANNGS